MELDPPFVGIGPPKIVSTATFRVYCRVWPMCPQCKIGRAHSPGTPRDLAWLTSKIDSALFCWYIRKFRNRRIFKCYPICHSSVSHFEFVSNCWRWIEFVDLSPYIGGLGGLWKHLYMARHSKKFLSNINNLGSLAKKRKITSDEDKENVCIKIF